eukprot:CAMPEP_0202391350 /NCGR_PEP_ID=MMETSP1127-20130417/91786_1 /ASSEMBLY_ACC=CAM_ASM_000462 /TAXON_ID=3047 /ORGANISM="Dunaliella tertiolecta, Strain CCMP1320" /LENGTH=524 /DNA_ID=CAMNT_0048993775 /DNA_START=16 /DNA_END=1590 /DNA_ORIENTATION=+
MPKSRAIFLLLVALGLQPYAWARFPPSQNQGAGIHSDISDAPQIEKKEQERLQLPKADLYGYLDVVPALNSSMYYMFYEAREPQTEKSKTPIVLWLQGGPGCSSLFGMLYINGPYWVNEDDLTLRTNPGSWNRLYGLLYIDQPIGTGFSNAGQQAIPDNEVNVAADLYAALNNFYAINAPHFDHRPLIVAGESYAGKYVPSLSHYILQVDAISRGYYDQLKHPRLIKPAGDFGPGSHSNISIPRPKFKLGGLAIGNGWTDADTQQMVQGEVAWSMGLIDSNQRKLVDEMSADVLELVKSKKMHKARVLSDQINDLISKFSGSPTLEDVRRNTGYDGTMLADRYLSQEHFMRSMGVRGHDVWISCSEDVDRILAHDVMKTVKHQVADLLSFHPVLLYQGQYDAECGVASNNAWIQSMTWYGHADFTTAPRELWNVNGRVMGAIKHFANLTQIVIRNTGHMVPHDNPYYGQIMLERWMEEHVLLRKYNRELSEEEEEMYHRVRGPDEGQFAGPGVQQRTARLRPQS